MDSYKIILTPDAEEDLVELREIGSLSELPARYKPVDDEPWHSRGIRRIIVNNFFVYYRIDEEGRRVYMLNVIYARRDQLRVLEQMNID